MISPFHLECISSVHKYKGKASYFHTPSQMHAVSLIVCVSLHLSGWPWVVYHHILPLLFSCSIVWPLPWISKPQRGHDTSSVSVGTPPLSAISVVKLGQSGSAGALKATQRFLYLVFITVLWAGGIVPLNRWETEVQSNFPKEVQQKG